MRVLIYMTGEIEIEIEARLQFDTRWNEWTAREIVGIRRKQY